MDVKEIVIAYLKANGFDGLFNGYLPCSCGLDDLAPHECNILECKPAYKRVCKRESCDCADWCDGEDGDDCYGSMKEVTLSDNKA